MKLIDYCTKMPKEDKINEGHKFPFNACELLCSINGFNINRILLMEDKENDDQKKMDIKEIDSTKKEEDEKKDEDNKGDEKKEDEDNKGVEKKEDKDNKGDEKKEDEDNKGDEKKEDEDKKDEEKKNEDKKDEEKKDDEKKENEDKKDEDKKEEDKKKEDESIKENSEKKIDKTEDNSTNSLNESPEIKNEEIKKPNQNLKVLYSLFSYLFNYLDTPIQEDDYVLSGYFSKITNNLLKDKPGYLLQYLFIDQTDVLPKFFNHITRKSTGNIIENILINLKDENIKESKQHLIVLFDLILEKLLKIEDDNYGIEVLCELIINGIFFNSKENFYIFICNNYLLEKFYRILDKFLDKKNSYIINLHNKFLENLMKIFCKKCTPDFNNDDAEIEINNLIRIIDKGGIPYENLMKKDNNKFILENSELIKIFEKIFNHLNELFDKILDNILKDEKTLNYNKILLWELFRDSLDFFINNYKINNIEENLNKIFEKIFEKKILDFMISTYFSNPLNNFYLNIFNSTVVILTNEIINKNIIEKIFNEIGLINLLINNIVENKYIFTESNNTLNSIFLANNISMLNSIFKSKNPNFIFTQNQQFFNNNLISIIYPYFEKKLYTNDEILKKNSNADLLNPLVNPVESETVNIPFTKKSIKEMVDKRIEIYNSFLKGENVDKELKEEENAEKLDTDIIENEEIKENEDIKNIIVDDEKEIIFEFKEENKENIETNNDINEVNEDKYIDNMYWNIGIKSELQDEIIKELNL